MLELEEIIIRNLGEQALDILTTNYCGEKSIKECIENSIRSTSFRRAIQTLYILMGRAQKVGYLYFLDDLEAFQELLRKNKFVRVTVDRLFKNKNSKFSGAFENVIIFSPRSISLEKIWTRYTIVIGASNKKGKVTHKTIVFIDPISENIMNSFEAKKVKFPPYIMKKLITKIKRKASKITYSVRSDITGVLGVEEIELRGTDVVSGLARLLVRLDAFKRVVSFFGPPILIEFDNGLSIRMDGLVSYKSLGDLVGFISLIELNS